MKYTLTYDQCGFGHVVLAPTTISSFIVYESWSWSCSVVNKLPDNVCKVPDTMSGTQHIAYLMHFSFLQVKVWVPILGRGSPIDSLVCYSTFFPLSFFSPFSCSLPHRNIQGSVQHISAPTVFFSLSSVSPFIGSSTSSWNHIISPILKTKNSAPLPTPATCPFFLFFHSKTPLKRC